MQLERKRAIVTGGGNGIGRAIALGLAREGATVVIADIDLAAAQRVVQEIEAAGGQALALACDVSNKSRVEGMVGETVRHLGGIDILINNAGFRIPGNVIDASEEDWDRVMAVTLKGPFLCSQAVLRYMIPQGRGKIVNTVSARGIYGMPGGASYAAAKAGLITLTRTLAQEVAPHNINVNAFAPGQTATAPLRRGIPPERVEELIRSGQMGLPEDMVETVIFLCSEASNVLTGQVINREVFMPR